MTIQDSWFAPRLPSVGPRIEGDGPGGLTFFPITWSAAPPDDDTQLIAIYLTDALPELPDGDYDIQVIGQAFPHDEPPPHVFPPLSAAGRIRVVDHALVYTPENRSTIAGIVRSTSTQFTGQAPFTLAGIATPSPNIITSDVPFPGKVYILSVEPLPPP